MIIFASFQLRAAAAAVGEADLEKKFAAASESLRRGIIFANSLYLWLVLLQTIRNILGYSGWWGSFYLHIPSDALNSSSGSLVMVCAVEKIVVA